MKDNIIYDRDGERGIDKNFLRLIVEEANFTTAWIYVSIYISKLILSNFHMMLIRERMKSNKTLIMAGRGLGKSMFLTETYTITKILRDRNIGIAIVSGKQTQASSFLSSIRKHFEEGGVIYDIWGDLRGDVWSKTSFNVKRDTNRKENTLTTTGITTHTDVVGKHFDIIIFDDIVGTENSSTLGSRNFIDEMLHESFLSAMDATAENTEIHFVGTHYNADDQYVRLEKQTDIDGKPLYHVKKIPAVIIDNGKPALIWRNMPNAERELRNRLNLRKNNPKSFQQQHQQLVVRANGEKFQEEWIKYFDRYEIINGEVFVYVKKAEDDGDIVEERIKVDVYTGVDLAISQKENSDNFALATIGVDEDANIYFLEMYSGKYSFKQQQNIIIKSFMKFYMTIRIGIEKNGFQGVMTQTMAKTGLPIRPIYTSKDKGIRFNSLSAKFEIGQVYFYTKGNDLSDLLEEILNYPDIKHDDRLDALCLAYETYLKGKTDKPQFIGIEGI